MLLLACLLLLEWREQSTWLSLLLLHPSVQDPTVKNSLFATLILSTQWDCPKQFWVWVFIEQGREIVLLMIQCKVLIFSLADPDSNCLKLPGVSPGSLLCCCLSLLKGCSWTALAQLCDWKSSQSQVWASNIWINFPNTTLALKAAWSGQEASFLCYSKLAFISFGPAYRNSPSLDIKLCPSNICRRW